MRVGNYTIPNVRLYPSLVEAVKTIYDTYPTEEISDMDALAKLLGHKSAKSGTFLGKMTFLRAYGLIEGRGTVKVSELGKKITYGNDEEKAKAATKAVLKIPLWNELYSRYSVNLPTDNFWAHLGKIAVLEAPDAQRVADNVRKAYLADTRYIKIEKELKEGFTVEPSKLEVGRPAITIPEGFTKIETEDFVVSVRRDLESIDSFERFDFKVWLDSIKLKLGKGKPETTKTEHEEEG